MRETYYSNFIGNIDQDWNRPYRPITEPMKYLSNAEISNKVWKMLEINK